MLLLIYMFILPLLLFPCNLFVEETRLFVL